MIHYTLENGNIVISSVHGSHTMTQEQIVRVLNCDNQLIKALQNLVENNKTEISQLKAHIKKLNLHIIERQEMERDLLNSLVLLKTMNRLQ